MVDWGSLIGVAEDACLSQSHFQSRPHLYPPYLVMGNLMRLAKDKESHSLLGSSPQWWWHTLT